MKSIMNDYNNLVSKYQPPIIDATLLFLRFYVAWVFFRAGLLKIDNWSSTQYLFQYEYQVPLLPWQLAAYLGTAAELILPLFLAIGLISRLAALSLWFFNVIAVLSYPTLLSSGFVLFSKGAMDHQIWGLMIFFILVLGAGKWSLDNKVGLS